MPTLLLALALSAAPAPMRVVAPGLASVNLEPARAEAYVVRLAQHLTYHGVRTATGSDLAAVLGHERQRQLLGCGDDTCRGAAVLDAAVDGLLSGTASKLGSTWSLDVRILEPGTAKVLAAASITSGDEDGLVASLDVCADQLAHQLSKALGRPLAVEDAVQLRRPSAVRRLSWLPLAVAVAAGAVGGAGLGLASGTAGLLSRSRAGEEPLSQAQAEQLVRDGQAQQTLGWVGVGVGAAGLAAAAAMFLLGGEEVVTAGVAFGPGQVGLGLTGVW